MAASNTRTRTTSVAHTDKRPKRCPHCGSTHVARKGTRKKKIEIVQLWRCASCKRVFTPAPPALRNKTYPLHVVLDAITLFDLGYTLEETTDKIKSRFGRRAGRSTVAAWLAEHRALTTYARVRQEGRRLFPPTRAIRSIKLYHRQIYKFEYHRAKLAMLRESSGARSITGHIDFLQVRNGAVHILDYKPGARADKPIAQLMIYALALTRLVPGLRLFDIKCAWFDEEEYSEFFPRPLIARRRTKAAA